MINAKYYDWLRRLQSQLMGVPAFSEDLVENALSIIYFWETADKKIN